MICNFCSEVLINGRRKIWDRGKWEKKLMRFIKLRNYLQRRMVTKSELKLVGFKNGKRGPLEILEMSNNFYNSALDFKDLAVELSNLENIRPR